MGIVAIVERFMVYDEALKDLQNQLACFIPSRTDHPFRSYIFHQCAQTKLSARFKGC
jgi:hypothetical protein